MDFRFHHSLASQIHYLCLDDRTCHSTETLLTGLISENGNMFSCLLHWKCLIPHESPILFLQWTAVLPIAQAKIKMGCPIFFIQKS